jgi:hypothetical protein
MPVYCQEKDGKNGYRFVLATLINNKVRSIKELNEALGGLGKNVKRYLKALRGMGMAHFLNRKEPPGQCRMFTPGKMRDAHDLDDGYNVMDWFSILRRIYNQLIILKPGC